MLGFTVVILGSLAQNASFEIILIAENIGFYIGGALSSISLSTERAPPLRNSPHTGFIYFPPKIVDVVVVLLFYIL